MNSDGMLMFKCVFGSMGTALVITVTGALIEWNRIRRKKSSSPKEKEAKPTAANPISIK